MQIDVLTIFPEMFESPLAASIVKRAQEEDKVKIRIYNLRDWATDKYKSVDDRPFGGGAGMVMRVDIVDRAVNDLKSKTQKEKLTTKVILLDTKGEIYHQGRVKRLVKEEHLILIVPHFEGIDHRVHDHVADEVICIGPYVLTGAELPAMVLIDSVTRLIPGVIKEKSLEDESYEKVSDDFFKKFETEQEYPQYTRPAEYKGWKVPEVLLNGNHGLIDQWRKNR